MTKDTVTLGKLVDLSGFEHCITTHIPHAQEEYIIHFDEYDIDLTVLNLGLSRMCQ